MIVSIGIDIIEIDEVKGSISRSKRFVERVFTDSERKYCDSKENKYQHYAARFAAKEAVMKALGTGWDKGIQWKQIEIQNNTEGKPKAVLYGKAKELIGLLNVDKIYISISHNVKSTIAMVIFEGFTDEEIHF